MHGMLSQTNRRMGMSILWLNHANANPFFGEISKCTRWCRDIRAEVCCKFEQISRCGCWLIFMFKKVIKLLDFGCGNFECVEMAGGLEKCLSSFVCFNGGES